MFLPTLRAVAKSIDRKISAPTVTELIAGTRETERLKDEITSEQFDLFGKILDADEGVPGDLKSRRLSNSCVIWAFTRSKCTPEKFTNRD